MSDFKKISLEVSMEDYVALIGALNFGLGYYRQLYTMHDGVDDEFAGYCDLRMSSLERLSHMVMRGGVWFERDESD